MWRAYRVARIRFTWRKGFTPDFVQRGLYCEDLKLEKEGEGEGRLGNNSWGINSKLILGSISKNCRGLIWIDSQLILTLPFTLHLLSCFLLPPLLFIFSLPHTMILFKVHLQNVYFTWTRFIIVHTVSFNKFYSKSKHKSKSTLLGILLSCHLR